MSDGLPALWSASSLIPLPGLSWLPYSAFSRQTTLPFVFVPFQSALPWYRPSGWRRLGRLLDTSLWWLLVFKMCFEAQFSLLLLGGKGWGRGKHGWNILSLNILWHIEALLATWPCPGFFFDTVIPVTKVLSLPTEIRCWSCECSC